MQVLNVKFFLFNHQFCLNKIIHDLQTIEQISYKDSTYNNELGKPKYHMSISHIMDWENHHHCTCQPTKLNFLTCLGASHQIPLSHDNRYGVLLYWCWLGVARQLDVVADDLTKIHLIKLQTESERYIYYINI